MINKQTWFISRELKEKLLSDLQFRNNPQFHLINLIVLDDIKPGNEMQYSESPFYYEKLYCDLDYMNAPTELYTLDAYQKFMDLMKDYLPGDKV